MKSLDCAELLPAAGPFAAGATELPAAARGHSADVASMGLVEKCDFTFWKHVRRTRHERVVHAIGRR